MCVHTPGQVQEIKNLTKILPCVEIKNERRNMKVEKILAELQVLKESISGKVDVARLQGDLQNLGGTDNVRFFGLDYDWKKYRGPAASAQKRTANAANYRTQLLRLMRYLEVDSFQTERGFIGFDGNLVRVNDLEGEHDFDYANSTPVMIYLKDDEPVAFRYYRKSNLMFVNGNDFTESPPWDS